MRISSRRHSQPTEMQVGVLLRRERPPALEANPETDARGGHPAPSHSPNGTTLLIQRSPSTPISTYPWWRRIPGRRKPCGVPVQIFVNVTRHSTRSPSAVSTIRSSFNTSVHDVNLEMQRHSFGGADDASLPWRASRDAVALGQLEEVKIVRAIALDLEALRSPGQPLRRREDRECRQAGRASASARQSWAHPGQASPIPRRSRYRCLA